MGYLGDKRLGVKRVNGGIIGQKSGRWDKRNVREQKNGRNSKLCEGAGRLGEIKVGDWEIQIPHQGLYTECAVHQNICPPPLFSDTMLDG